jgi:hypothetical protein
MRDKLWKIRRGDSVTTIWTNDTRYGSAAPMSPGDRITRVTGMEYWWAWLRRPTFSWIELTSILVFAEILRWIAEQL